MPPSLRRHPSVEHPIALPDGQDGQALEFVLDYLDSKNLRATSQCLHHELRCMVQSSVEGQAALSSERVSKLEECLEMLGLQDTQDAEALLNDCPDGGEAPPTDVVDATPHTSPVFQETSASIQSYRTRADHTQWAHRARHKPKLFDAVAVSGEAATKLRMRRGTGTPMERVVFHDSASAVGAEVKAPLAHVALPILYDPNANGLEDERHIALTEGSSIGKRYRVEKTIGTGTFSRVVACHDSYCGQSVSVKVMKNDKECLDAGLGEVRVLARLAQLDPQGQLPIIRLHDYFYLKEHLFIATELCCDTLNTFGRHLDQEGRRHTYFTSDCIASLCHQMCSALAFLHENGIVHCDVKTDNVCILSTSRKMFKLIDFGSAVMNNDPRNSYVQSRPYRAPEVMLGMNWGSNVDLWSLGAMIPELVLGAPIFLAPTLAQVLASIVAVAGPVPPAMARACSNLSSMVMTSDGEMFEVEPKGTVVTLQPRSNVDLSSLLREADSTSLVNFTAALLTIDPARRISAEVALEHPFLKSADVNKRTVVSHRRTFTAGTFSQRLPSYSISPMPSTNSTPNATPTMNPRELTPSPMGYRQQPPSPLGYRQQPRPSSMGSSAVADMNLNPVFKRKSGITATDALPKPNCVVVASTAPTRRASSEPVVQRGSTHG